MMILTIHRSNSICETCCKFLRFVGKTLYRPHRLPDLIGMVCLLVPRIFFKYHLMKPFYSLFLSRFWFQATDLASNGSAKSTFPCGSSAAATAAANANESKTC